MVPQGHAVGVGLGAGGTTVLACLMAAPVVQEAARMAVGPPALPAAKGPIFPGQLAGAPTPTALQVDPLVAGQLLPQAEGLPALSTAETPGIGVDAPVVLEGHEVGETFGTGLAAEVAGLVALPVIDKAASVLVGATAHLAAEGPLRAGFCLAALLGCLQPWLHLLPLHSRLLPLHSRLLPGLFFHSRPLLQGLHFKFFLEPLHFGLLEALLCPSLGFTAAFCLWDGPHLGLRAFAARVVSQVIAVGSQVGVAAGADWADKVPGLVDLAVVHQAAPMPIGLAAQVAAEGAGLGLQRTFLTLPAKAVCKRGTYTLTRLCIPTLCRERGHRALKDTICHHHRGIT